MKKNKTEIDMEKYISFNPSRADLEEAIRIYNTHPDPLGATKAAFDYLDDEKESSYVTVSEKFDQSLS